MLSVPYRYSYTFVYPVDFPAGAKSIQLPDNDKVRILAISVANTGPKTTPAQPLYDVLPPATSTSENWDVAGIK